MSQPQPPQVFISYAHNDKDRFVTTFAKRLFADGVHAWVDNWEILPGDSLVQKLFEEGIKNADAVVIVISTNSIQSNWVRQELDAAFVKRVDGTCKLIPIVLDNCEVPDTLKTVLYVNVRDVDNYDNEYQSVLRAIFDSHARPKIGAPPTWTMTVVPIAGWRPSDMAVFEAFYEAFVPRGRYGCFVYGHEIEAKKLNISLQDIHFVAIELADKGYLNVHSRRGDQFFYASSTTLGWEAYAKSRLIDYKERLRRILLHVYEKATGTITEIAAATGEDAWFVDYVLHYMDDNDLAVVAKPLGHDNYIYSVKDRLRRHIEDLDG